MFLWHESGLIIAHSRKLSRLTRREIAVDLTQTAVHHRRHAVVVCNLCNGIILHYIFHRCALSGARCARAASHERHLPNDPLIYVLSSSARGLLLFKRIPSCVHVDFNTTIVTALLIHRRNIHEKTSNNRVKNSFKMQIRTRICY